MNFYEEVSKDRLEKQKGTIQKAVTKGLELGLISNSDKKSMKPSGTTYVNALNMCLGWSSSKIIFLNLQISGQKR